MLEQVEVERRGAPPLGPDQHEVGQRPQARGHNADRAGASLDAFAQGRATNGSTRRTHGWIVGERPLGLATRKETHSTVTLRSVPSRCPRPRRVGRMTLSLAWTATILCAVAGVFAATRLVETIRPAEGAATRRTALLAALASAVLLAALAALYRIEAVAEADGRAVRVLSEGRGEVLVQVCRVITTMGDAVPALTLAGVLALWLLRVPGTGYWPMLLPLVVLAELLLQFGYTHVFDPLTLADVSPG